MGKKIDKAKKLISGIMPKGKAKELAAAAATPSVKHSALEALAGRLAKEGIAVSVEMGKDKADKLHTNITLTREGKDTTAQTTLKVDGYVTEKEVAGIEAHAAAALPA